jgi:hypothetical protein
VQGRGKSRSTKIWLQGHLFSSESTKHGGGEVGSGEFSWQPGGMIYNGTKGEWKRRHEASYSRGDALNLARINGQLKGEDFGVSGLVSSEILGWRSGMIGGSHLSVEERERPCTGSGCGVSGPRA